MSEENVKAFPIAGHRQLHDVRPTELLREVLGEIESGEVRAESILIFAVSPVKRDDGSERTDYSLRRCGPSFGKKIETLGWLEWLKELVMQGAREDQE